MVKELQFYYKIFVENKNPEKNDQILKLHNFMDIKTDLMMLMELVPEKTLAEQLFNVKDVKFNGKNCYAIKH
jgi:hypothetical protein